MARFALIDKPMSDMKAFVANVRRSLSPQTAADAQIVEQQLVLAREATWQTSFILPTSAILIAWGNFASLPLWRTIGWPALMTAVCIFMEIMHRRQRHGSTIADTRRRARWSARLTLLSCVTWCAVAFVMWIPDNAENHAFLLLVIAATLAGWSSMGAFHLATGAVAMPVHLVTMVALPLMGGLPNGRFEAAVCAAFWLLMRMLLMSNYRTRERMLRLENERGPLIENLKKAKQESDRARERAEMASRAKSAFLANMSHELRTPMNAILGFSEIIHTRALGRGAADQYAEYGGFIFDSGKHLLTLINDILDLAKIESGRMTLREEEVDLKRLIGECVQMLAVKAESGDIRFDTDIAPAMPNICGDERALRQIVVNLLSNALKFTPRGGRICAFANSTQSGIFFGVSDTGVGIELADQAQVFENFGQGRHDAVIADQGTGLGLPIVKGLAEAHGGTVALESAPGEGTRVTVTLPAKRIRERRAAA